ncbi:MAG: Txe/YoeB family addiction module toxin [Gemmatimonadota bacterium]|uniref:Txe/YoeB family addiction module toxin n=1 Tax=Candidatus Palauibacter scopulicola TaxID=3056741 RepID=UPI00239F8343|nr:Txe/YoeB family addiction module toxin [Candidatus Palauibacter scopulicola]MDE2664404.1 Txe/YoeB family addiction module toxin [Candidatus Palauibacter scopulicola]
MKNSQQRNAVFTMRCLKDLEYWTRQGPRRAARVLKLIRATLRDPFDGAGKPEPLRGELGGRWSRRVDREHRLTYRVTADQVRFLTARHHY